MIGVIKVNKRGQALIEFVIILPVLLLIIFAFIDLGRIILCKSHLESVMGDVITLYKENGNVNEFLLDDEYKISYQIEDNDYRKIILTSKLELITPGLKRILSNPYEVKVERSILYE